ncbi:hypothetical protein IWX90DRAFT_410411 [Phyllosticta citrichinensis]|uniref:Uncharacterized protein n=1 Tax=Phyllosticta citrichinensis TaxID=1130410 RepID=A0ABR1Y5A1_9PEZI
MPESLEERLTLIVDIYTAAEMYQLGTLKTMASRDFRGLCDNIFTLATFLSAVKTIYQGTVEQDRGLRDTLVTAAVQQLDRLLLNPASNEVLEEFGAFAKDLIHSIKWHLHKTVRVQCYQPNCYHQITLLAGNLEEPVNMLWCGKCHRAYGVGKWIVLPSVLLTK